MTKKSVRYNTKITLHNAIPYMPICCFYFSFALNVNKDKLPCGYLCR